MIAGVFAFQFAVPIILVVWFALVLPPKIFASFVEKDEKGNGFYG